MERLARKLDALSEASGRALAWLVLLLTLLVVYDVGMRFLFRSGSVALQELEWHLFAVIFLLGAAYTFKHDGHVRVGVVYQHLSERARLWVDLLGNLLFLIPFCVIVIQSSWPFVSNAFSYGEGSPDPGGLPYRFLIKGAIPVGFLLLMLQGVADVLRKLDALFGRGTRSG